MNLNPYWLKSRKCLKRACSDAYEIQEIVWFPKSRTFSTETVPSTTLSYSLSEKMDLVCKKRRALYRNMFHGRNSCSSNTKILLENRHKNKYFGIPKTTAATDMDLLNYLLNTFWTCSSWMWGPNQFYSAWCISLEHKILIGLQVSQVTSPRWPQAVDRKGTIHHEPS